MFLAVLFLLAPCAFALTVPKSEHRIGWKLEEDGLQNKTAPMTITTLLDKFFARHHLRHKAATTRTRKIQHANTLLRQPERDNSRGVYDRNCFFSVLQCSPIMSFTNPTLVTID